MWYKLPDPIFTMPKRQYKLKIVLNLNYKFSLFEAIIYIFFKFGKSEQKDWFQVDFRFLDVGILVDKLHVKITSQMYFISDINIILYTYFYQGWFEGLAQLYILGSFTCNNFDCIATVQTAHFAF